jgi:hypothetical protein
MRVQLTNAGAALLNANTGPIQVSTYQLGSDYGYIPEPTDTGIHGSLVYTGSPSQYFVVNSNVVKYSIVLDYSLGPLTFGEVGLFTSTGVLFALAVNDSLLEKIPATSAGGNAVRMDIYLSMVSENYEMWLDYADTNSDFRMATLNSPDQLPPTAQASPNAYVITGAQEGSSAFLAFTDRTGLWNFDAYAFAYQQAATIVACDAQSVTIANAPFIQEMLDPYYGQIICQFASGANYSICRYVSTVVEGSTQTVISFYNQLLQVPIIGDTVLFFARQALSTTNANIPVATTTTLGGVIVGDTLTVTTGGVLNVSPTDYPVLSVNGMTGDVEVTASDITGLATVATTGRYSDLIGAPGQYILPIATTTSLGGVKITGDGNITIAGDGTIDIGFSPVKSVNGTTPDGSGNVTVTSPVPVGLVTPAQIQASSDLNTYTTTGIFYCTDANSTTILNAPETTVGWTLDVESFSTTGTGSDCIQRLMISTAFYLRRFTFSTSTWSPWVQTISGASLPIATTTSTGMVSVGAGLNVTGTGALSAAVVSVSGRTGAIVITTADVGGLATVATSGSYSDLTNTPVFSTGLTNTSGTITVTGVTSNSLAAYPTPGFKTNPDGTIEMWGTATFPPGTNTVTITLPTPIPTNYMNGQATDTGTSCYSFSVLPLSSTQITVDAPQYWIDTGSIAARGEAVAQWKILCY